LAWLRNSLMLRAWVCCGSVKGEGAGSWAEMGLLMCVEIDSLCGVPYGQSNAERVNHRNGYRGWRWDTRVGRIAWPYSGCAEVVIT
jgi:hypothetical protein